MDLGLVGKTLVLIGAIWTIANSILLRFGYVKPGKITGYSIKGNLIIGIAFIPLLLSFHFLLPTLVKMICTTFYVFCIFYGLRIEKRAKDAFNNNLILE